MNYIWTVLFFYRLHGLVHLLSDRPNYQKYVWKTRNELCENIYVTTKTYAKKKKTHTECQITYIQFMYCVNKLVNMNWVYAKYKFNSAMRTSNVFFFARCNMCIKTNSRSQSNGFCYIIAYDAFRSLVQ